MAVIQWQFENFSVILLLLKQIFKCLESETQLSVEIIPTFMSASVLNEGNEKFEENI